MKRAKGITVEQIAVALKAKAGNVTEAAKALGISRQGLYYRINDSPTLQRVLQDTREELVDIAELALRRAVLDGNMTAIIWTLKASPAAKARGWSERQEVAHSGDVSLKTYVSVSPDDWDEDGNGD